MTVLQEARGLAAGYGHGAVIRDVDLEVRAGEVVALLGANGAGKTTTLLTLAGVLPPSAGDVRWLGRVDTRPLHRRAREGLAYVSEERSVFQRLTTRQNLAIARAGEIRRAIRAFPELEPLMPRRGGLLSGGEQQMLALARALSRPTRLLMADELSLGLALGSSGACCGRCGRPPMTAWASCSSSSTSIGSSRSPTGSTCCATGASSTQAARGTRAAASTRSVSTTSRRPCARRRWRT